MSEIASREDAQPAAAGAERCRWEYEPGKRCTRPTAPRRGTRGPAPVYCEQADAPGQPVHNPLNAWRAKTRPTDSAGENPQAGRAPVAEAIRTAGNALDRAEQLAAALRETAEQLAEAMATAADPDAAAAQISAQVADAEEQAGEARAATARERAARLAAEADAKDARQRAEEMAGQAETAQVDAEAARTDASSALTELQDRMIEHAAALQASRQEAEQAEQRAAAAEARAEDAHAEITRAREDAARELEQLRASIAAEIERPRADAARERDHLRELLGNQAQMLTEARDTQRQRAERAERDLDAARFELAHIRQDASTTDPSAPARQRRSSQTSEGS